MTTIIQHVADLWRGRPDSALLTLRMHESGESVENISAATGRSPAWVERAIEVIEQTPRFRCDSK